MTVRLFHGTTVRSGERILREGWLAQDAWAQALAVAREHDVDEDAFRADLARNARYLVVESDRGSRVSFTGRREDAVHHWAQFAPEALHEALWAVWRLQHAPDAPPGEWVADSDGRTWVHQQMRSEDPALLVLSLDEDELASLPFENGRLAEFPELLPSMGDVKIALPFRPRPGALHLVPLDRIVEGDVFARLLGITDDEFVARAEAGEFGPSRMDTDPVGYHSERPWWPQRTVDEVVGRS